jgi:hypothetical protein
MTHIVQGELQNNFAICEAEIKALPCVLEVCASASVAHVWMACA